MYKIWEAHDECRNNASFILQHASVGCANVVRFISLHFLDKSNWCQANMNPLIGQAAGLAVRQTTWQKEEREVRIFILSNTKT
jgi:hypothetical protein